MQTGKHIPIVALTANAAGEDRDKCFRSGMDGYISKPIKPEILYSYIRQYTK
ncbi:MAG: response regulator [Clostridiales bacterium]|nr:response regulator [Eubacteriales bacterium]MDH7567507.1 response regulator [Clostridiales bacterium]